METRPPLMTEMRPFKNQCLLLIVALCSSLSCRQGVPREQGSPELSLCLHRIDPLQKEIVFQLTVANSGPGAVTIPRLKEGVMEEFGVWMGVVIVVRGDKGEGFHLNPSSAQPMPRRKDLITLTQGQSFSVFINMAEASMFDQGSSQKRKDSVLAEMPGSYTAQASMNIDQESLPFWLNRRLWTGLRMSNPVRFTISNTVDNLSQDVSKSSRDKSDVFGDSLFGTNEVKRK